MRTQAQVQFAICYEQKGNLAKGQQYLEAANRLQPELLDAHRLLARVYYRQTNTPGRDHEVAIFSKLDSQQLRRRSRELEFVPSTGQSF